eukprot:CAMPEP_0114531564 /NCGR_PEP_ID=MMETSP0109-20121206/26133_1 /TAXON_ID=29199 /ORGANISM="Chlorarachnion reptans, Strain CCCM449" /LENGTH=505 /DNA_ID=CAMNT_0001714437 /DNA_START=182 /DNA_END=1699 /DNA_ORIENTATION=-
MEGLKDVQLESHPQKVERASHIRSEKVSKTMGWRKGPAGFVSAANDLSNKVRHLVSSSERLCKVLRTVYRGEREHNRKILNTLTKIKKDQKESAKEDAINPFAKAALLSEQILAKNAIRRLHIANDMLEQVINPLGTVVRDSKAKFQLISSQHRKAGLGIMALGAEVGAKRKESVHMLKMCVDARKREKEKLTNPGASGSEGGLSGFFSRIKSNVSEIVNGAFVEVVQSCEITLLQYQQTISKANRRQEKFIKNDLPRFLKHYARLTVSLSKMTKKTLNDSFEFQKKDATLKKLLPVLETFTNTIDPEKGLPMIVEACMDYYRETISTFTCKRWKYDLAIRPLQVKSRFGIQEKVERDFVEIKRNQKPKKLKKPKKNASGTHRQEKEEKTSQKQAPSERESPGLFPEISDLEANAVENPKSAILSDLLGDAPQEGDNELDNFGDDGDLEVNINGDLEVDINADLDGDLDGDMDGGAELDIKLQKEMADAIEDGVGTPSSGSHHEA